MKTRDKIIIVVYLNVSNIDRGDVCEYLDNARRSMFGFTEDGSAEVLILPIEDEDSHVECINPVLLDEKEYEKVKDVVERFKTAFDEFLAKANENSRTQ